MKGNTGKHEGRRAAAKDEPSPVTALRDLLAISFAADVAAIAPMVCDVLRDAMRVESDRLKLRSQKGALQALDGHGGGLALDVARAYRDRFDERLFGTDPMSQTQPIDDLSIMDDSKLKRVVALDGCAARLREQCGAEIFQLTARLCEMVGRASLTDSGNPLLPRLFCRCLMQGLKELGLNGDQRFEAFMAFSPALLHIVPDLYVQANGLLVERGILADFKSTYGRPVAQAPARPRAKEPRMEIPSDPREMAALLERLLKGGGRERVALAL